MQYDNTNKGTLWPNNRKQSAKSADMTGSIEVGREVVDHIMQATQRGGTAKLRLSAWRNRSRDGGDYYRISVYVPQEEQGGNQYRGSGSPRGGNYYQQQRPPQQRPNYNSQQQDNPYRERQDYRTQSRGPNEPPPHQSRMDFPDEQDGYEREHGEQDFPDEEIPF